MNMVDGLGRNECHTLQHAERDNRSGASDGACSKGCSDDDRNCGCRSSLEIRDDDRSIRKY